MAILNLIYKCISKYLIIYASKQKQKKKYKNCEMEKNKQKLGKIINSINSSESHNKTKNTEGRSHQSSLQSFRKSNLSKIKSFNKIQSFLNTPATIDDDLEISNMKACNFLEKGKLINNPIITQQVCKILEKSELSQFKKHFTLSDQKQSQHTYKLIGFQRKQIIALSKWVNYKMNLLKKMQNIQLSDLVEYRQYVVNLALGKLLDKLNSISVEMGELLSELWNKTFYFFEFVLELLISNKTKSQKQIEKHKLDIQNLHLSYMNKLKQRNQSEEKNTEILKMHFKNAIINNKQLKKQLQFTNNNLKKEIIKSECLEEALIKSIHINMQFGNGQILKWANRVLKSILFKNKQNNLSYKKLKYAEYLKVKAEEAIVLYLKQVKNMEALEDQQYINKYVNIDQFEIQDLEKSNMPLEEGLIDHNQQELTIKQIFELYTPKNIATSTTDLCELKQIETQSEVILVDVSVNTIQIMKKEKATQCQRMGVDKQVNTVPPGLKKKDSQKNLKRQQTKILKSEKKIPKKSESVQQKVKVPLKEAIPSMLNQSQEEIDQFEQLNDTIMELRNISEDVDNNSSISKFQNIDTQKSIHLSNLKIVHEKDKRRRSTPKMIKSHSFKFIVDKQPKQIKDSVQKKKFSQIYMNRKSAFFKDPFFFTQLVMNNRSFTHLSQIEVVNNQAILTNLQKRMSNLSIRRFMSKKTVSELLSQKYDHYNRTLFLNKNIDVNETLWHNRFVKIKNHLTLPKNPQKASSYLHKLFSTTIYELIKMVQNQKQRLKIVKGIKKKQIRKHISPLKYIIMNKLFNSLGMRRQNQSSINLLINNLITLKHFKEIEMFSMLMGLVEGNWEVGANQLDLYLKCYYYLDCNCNYRVQKETKTSIFIVREKIFEITEGYFRQSQNDIILEKIQRQDLTALTIEMIGKILIRKSIEKKKLSYGQYQYFYEAMKHPTQEDLHYFIKHLAINSPTKLKMLRQFINHMDCENDKYKWISYERFWTYCTNISFPNKTVITEYFRREALKPKAIRNILIKSYGKVIDIFSKNNVKIPAIVIKIKNFLDTKPIPKKQEFWINFLIVFCHNELIECQIQKFLDSAFLHIQANYIYLQSTTWSK